MKTRRFAAMAIGLAPMAVEAGGVGWVEHRAALVTFERTFGGPAGFCAARPDERDDTSRTRTNYGATGRRPDAGPAERAAAGLFFGCVRAYGRAPTQLLVGPETGGIFFRATAAN